MLLFLPFLPLASGQSAFITESWSPSNYTFLVSGSCVSGSCSACAAMAAVTSDYSCLSATSTTGGCKVLCADKSVPSANPNPAGYVSTALLSVPAGLTCSRQEACPSSCPCTPAAPKLCSNAVSSSGACLVACSTLQGSASEMCGLAAKNLSQVCFMLQY